MATGICSFYLTTIKDIWFTY